MPRSRIEIQKEINSCKANIEDLSSSLNSPLWASNPYDPRYISMKEKLIGEQGKLRELERELTSVKSKGEKGRPRAEIEKEISEKKSNIEKYAKLRNNTPMNSMQWVLLNSFVKSIQSAMKALNEELNESIEDEKYEEQKRKEQERREQERKERERQERERQERERQKREREEQERKERERKEQERKEQEARWRDVVLKNPDIKFLQDFLAKLKDFNTACERFESKAKENRLDIIRSQKNNTDKMLKEQEKDLQTYVELKSKAFREYESKLQELNQQEINRQNVLYAKITKCKRTKSPEEEIKHLRDEIFANKENIKQERDKLWTEYQDKCNDILEKRTDKWKNNNSERSSLAKKQAKELREKIKEIEDNAQKNINATIQKFMIEDFNSDEINKKYAKILADEPIVENYQCKNTNPTNIHIASLTHDLSSLNLGKCAKALLENHYPALYRYGKLYIPHCISFKEGFNYLFLVNAKNREFLVDKAKSLAMRLFMMIPPSKVNFTFIDPITLGGTFALFTNLVDVNSQTSKVINEKIWTSAANINERLRVLADHISDVIQRCLKDQYKDIQEYNEVAKQNAEPYQILMIMDFPSEFNEESLRLLEKIISTGPKCGVYTIIFKNVEQTSKIDSELSYINNIEANTKRFAAENNKLVMLIEGKEIPFFIKPLLPDASSPNEISLFPSETVRDSVIKALKAGIKEAYKIIAT
jgi:hypothetical protein